MESLHNWFSNFMAKGFFKTRNRFGTQSILMRVPKFL